MFNNQKAITNINYLDVGLEKRKTNVSSNQKSNLTKEKKMFVEQQRETIFCLVLRT
jgi:hypothetical protein